MHNETPNPSPLTNAVCMHCGYDISGITPDSKNHVICPECGHELQRLQSVEALTARVMHHRFAHRLMFPTCLPPALFMLCVWVPNVSILWGFIYLPCMLGLSIALWAVTVPRTLDQVKYHPQTVSRRYVVIWSIIYLLPQLVIEYVYWKLSFMFMIPV